MQMEERAVQVVKQEMMILEQAEQVAQRVAEVLILQDLPVVVVVVELVVQEARLQAQAEVQEVLSVVIAVIKMELIMEEALLEVEILEVAMALRV